MNERKPAGSSRPLLVLDFDGVICDSVEECFVSSWTAYHELFRGRPKSEPPASARTAFRDLRPFIRSGEDFVLVQELLHEAVRVTSQADFDLAWRRPGMPPRAVFKDVFYQARSALMNRDRRAWLAMNPIYPHVALALSRLSPSVELLVLSTKKPHYVLETLDANRLPVPPERVFYSEEQPKLSTVRELIHTREAAGAIFIEDQIDAIRGNTDPRIRVYLATWGYVQKSWVEGIPEVPLLGPGDFVELLAGLDKEPGPYRQDSH